MVKPKDQNGEKGRLSPLSPSSVLEQVHCVVFSRRIFWISCELTFTACPKCVHSIKHKMQEKLPQKSQRLRSNFLRFPPLPGANASHSSCAVKLFARWWTVANFSTNHNVPYFQIVRIKADSIKPMRSIGKTGKEILDTSCDAWRVIQWNIV